MAVVEYHPYFSKQFQQLGQLADTSAAAAELFGDVSALTNALEDHGHDIESEAPAAASHPIVTSRYRAFALRRTPPTNYTPYADSPPVLRIPYVWCMDTELRSEFALVLMIGGKTKRKNLWYPMAVRQIQDELLPSWQRQFPNHKPLEQRR